MNLDIQFIKDLIWAIGWIIGIVGGLYAIREVYKKKPRLDIDDIKIGYAKPTEYEPVYGKLFVEFNLWNGKTWWKRRWTSDAERFTIIGTIINNDRESRHENKNTITRILYPNTKFRHYLQIRCAEDYDKLKIKVVCDKSTITKDFKIKDYLQKS